MIVAAKVHTEVLDPCAKSFGFLCTGSLRFAPPVKDDDVAEGTSGTYVTLPTSRTVNSL